MSVLSSCSVPVAGVFSRASGKGGLACGMVILDKERTKACLGISKLAMLSMKYDRMMMSGNFLNETLSFLVEVPINAYLRS